MSKLYIALAIAASLGGLAWLHERHAASVIDSAVSSERDRINALARDRLAAANKRALDAETQAAVKDLEGQRELEDLAERARSDAGRAADELGRLRGALAVYRRGGGPAAPGAGAVGGTDATSPLADALSQCSERYAGVAAVADQLSIQVTGLQRYITEVAGPICIAGIASDATTDATLAAKLAVGQ